MKRKHPLRRIVLSVAGTASAVVLLLAVKQPGTQVAGPPPQAGGAVQPAAPAPAGGGGEPVGEGEPAGGGGEPGAGGGEPAAGGGEPAGGGAEPAGGQTVLGNEAATQYGPVQVRLTVAGGRITAADAVKAPASDANSRRIAADAVPQLNKAAVAAQSAQIDAVSGASYTSQGYITSLQSALDKAGL
ncbi:FMN-binding protein [Streptomyces sp. NBC_01619]|uniref:FMN-binding protein n=1 Tax=unclassified Streptomyces TaxID=2593676 RepID=UPI00224EAE7A|nr:MULTISPECIES: FMN-binding protein [unclassified Streptomyces]MCX4510173.1 FMN-binding protein [Streptomyces sp. NBC_01619]